MITHRIRAYMAACWLAIALLAVPRIALAEFSKVEERAVGRWVLTAVVETGTDYAICLVTTQNELGEHLNIVIERPKHRWSLAFAGIDVHLREGVASDFQVTYAIDDNEPRRAEAIPSASGRVFIPLGQDVALTEPVRHGSRIAFATADGIHAFSLAGSAAALDAVSDCAARRLGYEDVTAAETTAPESGQTDFTQIGAWQVEPLKDDKGLVACVAARRQANGIKLVFGVDRDAYWQIGLINDRWNLTKDDQFDLQYAIDDGAPVQVTAHAAGKNLVMVYLESGAAVAMPFKQGSQLRVIAAKGTFTFDLSGSSRALDAAYDCMVRNGGSDATAQDPFSAPGPSSAPEEDGDSYNAPATSNPFESRNRAPAAGAALPVERMSWDPQLKMYLPMHVGSWTVIAYDDRAGMFDECITQRSTKDDIDMQISLSREHRWELVLIGGPWPEGTRHRVSFGLDGGEVLLSAPASAMATILRLPLIGEEATLIGQISRARRIDFQVDHQRLSYPLPGIDRALDATRNCVDQLMAEQTAPH